MDNETFERLTKDLSRVLNDYNVPPGLPIRIEHRVVDMNFHYWEIEMQCGQKIISNRIPHPWKPRPA